MLNKLFLFLLFGLTPACQLVEAEIYTNITDRTGINYTLVYRYDYRNRLTEIEDVVSFVYDALGRRIKKVDLVTDKITWYYHNLSGQVIAEYEQPSGEDPALARSFAYGNGISEVLVMFLAEPPCDPEDLDEFIDFASHWLCADPNACYDPQFDAISDDVIFSPSSHHVRAWRYYKVRPISGAQDPAKTVTKYCLYDSAHKDYVYTEEWVLFLLREFSEASRFKEVMKYRG